MKPADLPADIARHPSVAMADANWKANLVERLQRRARQQARENEQARR
jgi:hypothetical protein